MYQALLNIIPPNRIKRDEPMSRHTTFKIGGPADYLISPASQDEVIAILAFCHSHHVPLFVFGLGSNLLVRDKGIRGIVVKLGDDMKNIRVSDTELCADAGVRLSHLAKIAAREGLSGLEFAEGIPGSLGGAVVMNAGAYNGEISQVLTSATAVDSQGSVRIFACDEIHFQYRSSIFQSSDFIVLSACLNLTRDDPQQILLRMQQYSRSRREKQPLDLPSAGSAFKRPPGFFVGPLLEQLGLKGYQIGGAQVSSKHAGFIVNTGNARAVDVVRLIEFIQHKAYQEFGVDLHPEIRVVGEK